MTSSFRGMSQEVRLGPCTKVFSGEFIGRVTVPQFKWICEDCLVEGQDSFVFGPPFAPRSPDPARFAELKALKVSRNGKGPPCPGDYGNPAGIFRAGKYTDDHL